MWPRRPTSSAGGRPCHSACLLVCLMLSAAGSPVFSSPLLSETPGAQQLSSRASLTAGEAQHYRPERDLSADPPAQLEPEVGREPKETAGWIPQRSPDRAALLQEERQVAGKIQRVGRRLHSPDLAPLTPQQEMEQEQEAVREVKQVEEDAAAHQLRDEEAIAAEIRRLAHVLHMHQSGAGPDAIAQQKEVAAEIEEEEQIAQAQRPTASPALLAQEEEIAAEIKQAEKIAQAQRPTASPALLALEEEIAREVKEVKAKIQAVRSRDPTRLIEEESEIAGIIRDIQRRISPNAVSSSSSEETGSENSEENTDDDDDDEYDYDDAFESPNPGPSKAEADNAKPNANTPDSPLRVNTASAGGSQRTQTARQGQGHPEQASDGQGRAKVKPTSSRPWQVTAMTVLMCSVVGVVMLLVVGVWYRHLSPRSQTGHMLLVEDEDVVYRPLSLPRDQAGQRSPPT